METKHCGKCDATKPVSEFPTRKGKPESPCKACKRSYNDSYGATGMRQGAPERQAAREQAAMADTKRCSECGKVKPRTAEFWPSRSSDGGLRGPCKECRNDKAKKTYKGAREALLAHANPTQRAAVILRFVTAYEELRASGMSREQAASTATEVVPEIV
jgi:hypothetical protein